MRVGIIDYGAGNLLNVARALSHLGFEHLFLSNKRHFDQVDRIVLPGVGAFHVAMEQLESRGLISSIRQAVTDNQPLLGICLGMQLLFEQSSEFQHTVGLGVFEGDVQKIRIPVSLQSRYKVPHIGWNKLAVKGAHSLNTSMNKIDGEFVYFVHSYMANVKDDSDVVAWAEYAGLQIPAMVNKGKVWGCQFHPEKSAEAGLAVLASFLSTESELENMRSLAVGCC